MIGNPKFKYGDKVSFEMNNETMYGEIYIVDKFGTLFDDSDVSYDIMVENDTIPGGGKCLYKHISEKFVKKI